jgi:hypothetical protein
MGGLGGLTFKDGMITPSTERLANVFETEDASQVELLHCLFDDVFRRIGKSAGWWRDATAVRIAQAVYDDQRFQDMPLLADALEEAGCDNDAVLHHGRQSGSHARGCWVLDRLLGKS